jgi:excisionase family DNA binding protein
MTTRRTDSSGQWPVEPGDATRTSVIAWPLLHELERSGLVSGTTKGEVDSGASHSSGSSPAPVLLVTPEEAARALSLGRTTVYQLMRTGELASVVIGRSRRIPVTALAAFVDTLVATDAR